MITVESMLIICLLPLVFTSHPLRCDEGRYICRSGKCINTDARCDGTWDCPNGDDELDCPNARPVPTDKKCNRQHNFLCVDESACIPLDWRCDDEADCDDHSDEFHCHKFPAVKYDEIEEAEVLSRTTVSSAPAAPANSSRTCSVEEFFCKGGSCIPFNLTCNGKRDCPLGDDETGHCDECSSLVRAKCSHQCTNSPHGQKCSCPEDMLLSTDHHTCITLHEDVDLMKMEWEEEPKPRNTVAVFLTGTLFMGAALVVSVIGAVVYVRSRSRQPATSLPSASMVNAPLHTRSLSTVYFANPALDEGEDGAEDARCIVGNDA